MGRTSRRRCGEGYRAGYQMGDAARQGFIGGAVAGALAMNAETSEKLGLAKSYGTLASKNTLRGKILVKPRA